MLQYSRLNHSSKTGSTILKPSPDFSMKSLSTRVFLFLVMVRGAPSPYSATTCSFLYLVYYLESYSW